MSSQPSNAGIITEASGHRHIPESTRADGSTRRAIRIRPGYQPPEDVALYKNRTAESFRNRHKGGVPGAEAATATVADNGNSNGGSSTHASATAQKNAKRREARKAASDAANRAPNPTKADKALDQTSDKTTQPAADAAATATEHEKKARGLKKKLKQARELQNKHDGGETLLPEQIAKVIRINELVRALEALGLDAEGEAIKGTKHTKGTAEGTTAGSGGQAATVTDHGKTP